MCYETDSPFPPSVEYTVSALLDQRMHALSGAELVNLDLSEFEKQQLTSLSMPEAMVPRHRAPHFQHLFSGSSYAAQYYVYLWAEVLDADAFDAFEETGDIFEFVAQPKRVLSKHGSHLVPSLFSTVDSVSTAARAKKHIYAAGNTVEPGTTYAAFRGRAPVIEPMLKKKGLL